MSDERREYPPLRLVILEPSCMAPPMPPEPARRGRAWIVGTVLFGIVLLVAAAGAFLWPVHRAAREVRRIPAVFDSLGVRPAALAPNTASEVRPVTFLLIGSDDPAPRPADNWPGGRSDAILLARLAADRRHAQVVSIPRDAWVDVPDHGMAKINAAYAWGGPRLLVRTVERLTGTRVDHVAAIDFAGLAGVVDTLGGITVAVAESTAAGGTVFLAGDNALDGGQAVHYVRQRHGLLLGDLDRIHRHQELLRGVLTRLDGGAVFEGPSAPAEWLRSLLHSVQVDDQLSPLDVTAWLHETRILRQEDVRFLTAPVAGFGREGAQSVVRLDSTRTARLWEHLRHDELAEHLDEFAAEALPARPR